MKDRITVFSIDITIKIPLRFFAFRLCRCSTVKSRSKREKLSLKTLIIPRVRLAITMNITIKYKKQKALELMKTLDIYKPYIKGFEKDNNVCFFEGFGGFWAYQEPELMAKIKEFEEKHNCLVYAVTHEYLEFGECYDFLFISDYEEEWDEMLDRQDRTF